MVPTVQPANDATIPYTTYRVALASGILGSAGATLGWLGWLAIRMRSWELVITVLVGAALGFALHWIQHYVRVARRESQGEGAGSANGEQLDPKRSLMAIAWAAGFGFLGLVSEHLVGHMAVEFLRPFLASLATLFPAGIIIGWTMNRAREKDEHGIMVIANGLFVGGVVTVVTGIIWTVGFGTAPWFELYSWWGLVGVGTRVVARQEHNAVRFFDPIVAVALTFGAILVINLLPLTTSWYSWLGPFSSPMMNIRAMALLVQRSPALPATFWTQAEDRFDAEFAPTKAPAAPVERPRPDSAVAPMAPLSPGNLRDATQNTASDTES